MARPRVFVSSTYYDLKHIRSSLDLFIGSLGYDSILSEKGDIAYNSDSPLDESCYREVGTADIFVLIIGGRYGSPTSRDKQNVSADSLHTYESVTKREYSEAVTRDIPIFILIEHAVYSEYQTYLKNKHCTEISYAHVDNVNVFHLIEEILSHGRNNPVQPFDKFFDIESWLREQWAGLFRDYLNKKSSQKQLSLLADQVEALQEVSTTLKRYLEEIFSKVSPDDSSKVIAKEELRRRVVTRARAIKNHPWHTFLLECFKPECKAPDITHLVESLEKATSIEHYGQLIGELIENPRVGRAIVKHINSNEALLYAFNHARERVNAPPLSRDDQSTTPSE